jgi:biopolymer transport protein ExbD
MAMSVGGGRMGVRSEINITPLVDVVLVLLIIFMVIVPILQMGYEVRVPPKVTGFTPPTDSDQVIVRIDHDGRYYINKQQFSAQDFPARLREAMTGRSRKLAFLAADGELPYGQVATFLDLCRHNGAENIGIVFEDLNPAGQAAATP